MSVRMTGYLQRRPHWYPGDDADWAAHVEPVILREDQAWQERLIALGRWYGIDLYKEVDPFDCYHRLLFELAEEHVPGFAIGHELGAKLPGKGAPPVLDTGQTIRLAACVCDALSTGEQRDGSIAKMALAKVSLDVPRRGCGPRKGGMPGSVPLKRQTATHLVRQMRRAWCDVLNGCASAYQFQVLTLALVSQCGYDMVPDWAVIFGLRQPNIHAD
jgi:hypothetical protein